MKKINKKKTGGLLLAAAFFLVMLSGCQKQAEEEPKEDILSENIVITETGEVLEKEEPPAAPTEKATAEPKENPTATPEIVTPEAPLVEPEQEQVISEENQTEPKGHGLQLVFLGDSIFDTYRDGSGIPYMTSVQCEADVYNLAIGGTCAALEYYEVASFDEWTSTSLLGVVNAMAKKITTDIFEGKAVKDILDNPNIDFSQTDYFIVEYGMNDFLRATPLDSESEVYDLKTYAGALRYAISNLRNLAPDATIILCAPNYAQFYNENWMIGDGNSVNNGYGTLADYVGICNYVAKEQQVLFFNAYQDLGIDNYTAEEYLEDGVHLSDAGRELYADELAKIILKYEETKNN